MSSLAWPVSGFGDGGPGDTGTRPVTFLCLLLVPAPSLFDGHVHRGQGSAEQNCGADFNVKFLASCVYV